MNRGNIFFVTGDYEKAAQYYKEALSNEVHFTALDEFFSLGILNILVNIGGPSSHTNKFCFLAFIPCYYGACHPCETFVSNCSSRLVAWPDAG